MGGRWSNVFFLYGVEFPRYACRARFQNVCWKRSQHERVMDTLTTLLLILKGHEGVGEKNLNFKNEVLPRYRIFLKNLEQNYFFYILNFNFFRSKIWFLWSKKIIFSSDLIKKWFFTKMIVFHEKVLMKINIKTLENDGFCLNHYSHRKKTLNLKIVWSFSFLIIVIIRWSWQYKNEWKLS